MIECYRRTITLHHRQYVRNTYPLADLLGAVGGIGHGSSLLALVLFLGKIVKFVHDLLLIGVEVRTAQIKATVRMNLKRMAGCAARTSSAGGLPRGLPSAQATYMRFL